MTGPGYRPRHREALRPRRLAVLTVSRQAFSKDCPWPGGEENHIQLDLADLDGLPEAIEGVRGRLKQGRLHALVNNAGISPKGAEGERLGVLGTPAAVWQKVFSVNLFSTALLASGLAVELREAKGAIVNVTSIAGSRVHPFAGVAYAASKAALASLTREMAHDFGAYGVRVNAIAPGEIDTSILSPGTEHLVEREIPMRRLGLPAEVAETIFFLCTEPSPTSTAPRSTSNGGQHV